MALSMAALPSFASFCNDWFPPESLPILRQMLSRSGAIFYGLEVLRFIRTIPSSLKPVLNIAVPSEYRGSFAALLCLHGYVSDGFGEHFIF